MVSTQQMMRKSELWLLKSSVELAQPPWDMSLAQPPFPTGSDTVDRTPYHMVLVTAHITSFLSENFFLAF